MTRSPARWVAWLWIWIGWTALALFLGISSSLAYLSIGNPPLWSLTIRMALVETYVWALLAPFVMWLARRVPFTRSTRWRALAVLVPASILVSVFKLALDRLARRVLFGFSSYLLFTSLAPNFLFYWAIVAVAHGVFYYRANREKEVRALQLEAKLAQARLKLLEMQLHPHFLFNTLHTISELVHEDPETADRMIAGLSELLREALAAGDVREVTLAREMALLERYLEIQQARFGDRLRIEVHVDPGVRGALVPHLILQPIVENAISHGINTRAAAGRVRVAARCEQQMLVLTVEDDGVGMGDSTVREGVGLGNTRARLQELYGSKHRFDIRAAATAGVIVTLALPFNEPPQ